MEQQRIDEAAMMRNDASHQAVLLEHAQQQQEQQAQQQQQQQVQQAPPTDNDSLIEDESVFETWQTDLQNVDCSIMTGTFDGACKGNGAICNDEGDVFNPTGWGVTLSVNGRLVWWGYGPAGPDPTRGTSNTAEYTGAERAFFYARKLGAKSFTLSGDSSIAVDSFSSNQPPPDDNLSEIYAASAHNDFDQCNVEYIIRSVNAAADELANKACARIVANAQAANDPRLNAEATPRSQTPALWCTAAGDGIAYCLRNQGGGVIWQGTEPAPAGTANAREYHALIAGVREAARNDVQHFTLVFANQLQLNQVAGHYKVKPGPLRDLCAELQEQLKPFDASCALATNSDANHPALRQLKDCARRAGSQ